MAGIGKSATSRKNRAGRSKTDVTRHNLARKRQPVEPVSRQPD